MVGLILIYKQQKITPFIKPVRPCELREPVVVIILFTQKVP